MEDTYTLEGLRGVGRVELVLRPDQRAYVFFGSNGVGKTKCLEGLFQNYWNSNKKLKKLDYRIIGSSPTTGRPTYEDVSLYVAKEFSGAEKYNNLPILFLGAGKRGHLDVKSVKSEPLGDFESRREKYFISLMSGMMSDFSSLGMDMGLEQWIVRIAHSANPFQKLKENRQVEIETLLWLLHQVDERFDSSFLQIDGNNIVSIKVDGVVTKIRHLSTGFASLLKIFQTIISGYGYFTNKNKLAEVKGLVFIDEIESHLHTSWQSKIIPLLKKLFPNTTFFIATHSPIVLSQLEEGEAYRLERQVDGVVRASVIEAPNRRILDEVLDDAMGVNLNALKKKRLEQEDQSELKQKLQKLLDKSRGKN